jgi:2-C-methyl-D-erythritol 4-phosphate cytidylyltransferase
VESWGIVLAAGTGERFGDLKQFRRLGDTRLVDHSIRTAAAACDAVVLVLPLGVEWDGDPVAAVVPGGPTRITSARAGLAAVPSSAGIVVVHDAAHPLASVTLFERVIDAVRQGADAAVPAVPTRDTIMRFSEGRVMETVDREGLVIVQTPQAFRPDLLRLAHASSMEGQDDSVLVARCGSEISVVPGDPRNIHVTTREELELAARLLGSVAEELRS